MQPQIKICGLVCEEDILLVNQLDINYVGFVLFYEKSKRCISIEKAKELIKKIRPDIKTVAVVVSPTQAQIKEIEEEGFDVIQIHGDLSETIMNQIHIPLFRAGNISGSTDVQKIKELQSDKISCIVVDGKEPGSGRTFQWEYLLENVDSSMKIMLAGGLNEKNVCTAIEMVNPYIVDVSSSVEKVGGIGKDKDKVVAFVEAVRKRV